MQVTSLSEYVSFVESLPPEFSVSRGQSQDFPLFPSALRTDRNTGKRKYSKRSVREFLAQFKINSHQYINAPWDVKNDIEWMLYAQHFGLPTKLLDFSYSHITSLLFSVEKAFQSSEETDSVVYFLNPNDLNQKNSDSVSVINVSDSDSISAEQFDGPVAVQGRLLNARINAQKGLFVLFQDDDKALNEIDDENTLRKITIAKESTRDLLTSLFNMGISFSHIYPEITSISRDILLRQDISDYLRD